MSVIKGGNVVLTFLVNGQYKSVCCAREVDFVTNSELAETSTDGTGIYRTYRGVRHTWSVSCSGLVSFDMNHAISTMRDLQRSFTEILIAFSATDDNGLIETYTGSVIIETIDTSASYTDLYKYSLTARGTGEYQITDDPVDPAQICGLMVEKYDGTGSETGGNILPALPVLAGKEVLWLERDGVYYRRVEGTPVKKQFRLDPDDDTVIIFADNLPAIQAGVMIDVIYQNV